MQQYSALAGPCHYSVEIYKQALQSWGCSDLKELDKILAGVVCRRAELLADFNSKALPAIPKLTQCRLQLKRGLFWY